MFTEIVLGILLALVVTGILQWQNKRLGLRPAELSGIFLIVLLSSVAIMVWARPVGPILWGIAWFPALAGTLILGLAIALGLSRGGGQRLTLDTSKEEAALFLGGAALFWVLICILTLATLVGYFYSKT